MTFQSEANKVIMAAFHGTVLHIEELEEQFGMNLLDIIDTMWTAAEERMLWALSARLEAALNHMTFIRMTE